jgi:chromate reductase, NAD(P)H dehydrogenase (quinone)
MRDFHILGISGSLRKSSYNSAALRAAQEVQPEGMMITLGDISAIPIYNDDVREAGFPPSVLTLVEQVATADAVLIATPEYNYSLPGVLKNAIDWVSKAPDQPFRHKPVAIMGASMGGIGTARAQYDLRKVFVFLDAHVLNQPEIMISGAHTRFDADGHLTDEPTRTLIGKQIIALKEWAMRLRD